MTDEELDRRQLDAILPLLSERLGHVYPNDSEERRAWFRASLDAFRDMKDRGYYPLSDKQRAWVRKVADVLDVDLPEPLRAPVPRGKPVDLLVDKMKRPNKPPSQGRAGIVWTWRSPIPFRL
jgi:hypothetical protein